MSIEAMKQAIEVLEEIEELQDHWTNGNFAADLARKASGQLRTAIQQAEAQQPATGDPVGQVSDLFPSVRNKLHVKGFGSDAPLYTHPAPGVPDGWSDRHKRVAAFALRLFADAAWGRSDEAAQKNYIGNHGDYKAFQTDAEDAEEARSILLAASPAQKGGER